MIFKIKNRIQQYLILMRFHKPIGIFLLLWPTLWALWVAAKGIPDLLILTIFVCGVIVMRAAGCVINDIVDRQIDGHIERTKMRPLVNEAVSLTEAISLFVILCIIAFSLVLLTNMKTILLAIPALLLVISYPFMKRYTHWPQLFLGIAFAWSIPMSFTAQTGHVASIAWLIFLTTVLWVVVYDTMYAMVDREDDLKIGVKSTAIFFGSHDVWVISFLQLIILSLLLLIGWMLAFHVGYFMSIALAALLIIYQQALIRRREPEKCFRAFLNNNWFGLLVFVGIIFGF